MSPLTAFGLFAVTSMLVFYALEPRSVAVRRWSVQWRHRDGKA